MKVLVVTQVVDQEDPVLGFFHRWLIEFARNVESLTVICLYEGKHALPDNVKVYSLGKEKGRRSAFSYAIAFKKMAWDLRNEYDHVFVHMNPEYLIIAGPMWKVLGKRTALWYLHKSVNLRLHLGILFADVVFTASPQSMRVRTGKKRIVGHGIASGTIVAPPPYPPLSLLTVGRLSPVKRVHLLIEAFEHLRRDGIEAYFTIAGSAAGAEGQAYEHELRQQAEGLGIADRVIFRGAVPHAEVRRLYEDTHLFLHASNTGSLDKASLEPLVSGVPVVTTDSELAGVGIAAIVGTEPHADAIAGAIRKAIGERLWDQVQVREEAHEFVHQNHELSTLIPRILAEPRFSGHR